MKAAIFETGHGFALGHNPGAPSPFVTWQFTEGETAIGITTGAAMEPVRRGRRGTLTAGWTTISSFTMRRSSIPRLGPEGVYRYYSTQRPVDIGTYPKPPDNNGYILHIDLAPIKELIALQRRCSNNLNQVAVHAHTYGVYPEEIDGLKRDYEKLWGEVSKVLRELSELVAK